MRARRLPLVAALVAAAGCASFRVDPDKPGGGDLLLGALESGVASLQGGDAARAAELFDHAYWLNEERETRSLSAGASALVASDVALPYRPSPVERALLHYYGARAWLARQRPDEAAVEARRLSALLADLVDSETEFEPGLMATLHDVAAAVYAVAGEWDDAVVAERLRDRYRDAVARDAVAPALCDSCGELVVIAEAGRVARRVPRSLTVAVSERAVAAVVAAGDGGESIAASLIALDQAVSPRYCGWSHRAVCGWDRRRDREQNGTLTLVRVAWPELAAPLRALTDIEIGGRRWEVGGQGGAGNISLAVGDDFSRDAPARLARAVGRTVARQAMVKAGNEAMARAKKEKKKRRDGDEDGGNGTGWVVAGAAAYVLAGASTLAERADTRSWRSLPDDLAVIRLALPPGPHEIRHDGKVVAEVQVVSRGVSIVHVRR